LESPVGPSIQPSKEPLKKANDTFLEAVPPYIRAIISPDDKTFPRLACSLPNAERYQYLRLEGDTANKGKPDTTLTYFFALDLHECRGLLPRLLGSIVETMRFLGPRNCALSIVEGRSYDGTYEVLLLLREEIERMGARYFLTTNEIDPLADSGKHRIQALSELRNQALQPLIDIHPGKETATTVVFINDVAICTDDILELVHQRRHQNADMTCAMDWIDTPDPPFYDVWIGRGMTGDSFFYIPPDGNWGSSRNLFWNDPETKQRFDMGKPFQVFSCWNGAVAFTAKPVVERKIRFRAPLKDECHQGEPTSFCKDLWVLGHGKIAVVPSVNVGYSDESAQRIKSSKGYVSDYVGSGDADDEIDWKMTPPEKVKCMGGPQWENQHFRPWDEKVRNSTTP
ncbi:MAG: hypothetical protein LQ338_007998, partial [Usnochroma carphineum]